ncbi:MAG TPA: hypothetical protein VM452_12320 [Caulifigura sp.]|nr:hypothetical protein [Caulifigura sp.]
MTPRDFPTSFYLALHALAMGTISKQQHEELERQLEADPAARQAYYDFLDVDQGLAEIAASAPPVASEPQPASKSRRSPLIATLIAASILVTLAVEWSLLGIPKWGGPVTQQRIVVPDPAPQFVATLVRSTDCEWEDHQSPFFEGKRLLSSNLRLRRGVAEFRFDTGVRLILEGPVRMTVKSARSATLDFGKVVLHGHELAAEFALETPRGTLFDVGTEYGTTVDNQSNVELHVFEGKVRVLRTEKDQQAEVITAGAARRLVDAGSEEVPLQPERFLREVPGRKDTIRIPRDGLMAYEGFAAPDGNTPEPVWQFGGTGWDGGWRFEIGGKSLSRAFRDAEESLEFEGSRRQERDGALHLFPGRATACRILQQPIRLDTDAIYYVSFYLAKQSNVHHKTAQYGSLSLRTGNWPADGRRLLFGVSSERLPLLSHHRQNHTATMPLSEGEPYFFVAKIVAGQSTPDQVMLRVFSREESIPDQEPAAWTCISEPAYDDTVFDHVLIYVEGTDYAFDEIRVASSWDAVAGTGLDAPQP